MNYSNVLHNMSRGSMIICEACYRCRKRLMLHYPYDEVSLSMCNGGYELSRVMINIVYRNILTNTFTHYRRSEVGVNCFGIITTRCLGLPKQSNDTVYQNVNGGVM